MNDNAYTDSSFPQLIMNLRKNKKDPSVEQCDSKSRPLVEAEPVSI